jgi:hypothetical protein
MKLKWQVRFKCPGCGRVHYYKSYKVYSEPKDQHLQCYNCDRNFFVSVNCRESLFPQPATELARNFLDKLAETVIQERERKQGHGLEPSDRSSLKSMLMSSIRHDLKSVFNSTW